MFSTGEEHPASIDFAGFGSAFEVAVDRRFGLSVPLIDPHRWSIRAFCFLTSTLARCFMKIECRLSQPAQSASPRTG